MISLRDGMRRRRLGAALLAALAVASPLSAAPLDPLGDPDQFRRDIDEINRRPLPDGEALARAAGAAVLADAKLRGRCQPKKIALGQLEPVTLDGMITGMISRGEIDNGWLVSVRLEDCPPADPIRVLLVRQPGGAALRGFFAGQGETLAWPSLATEVLRAMTGATMQQLRRSDPACTPPGLTQSAVRVTSRSADLGPSQYGIRLKGSWSEVWTFEPCGHRLTIPISFRTNGSGGAYWDIDTGGILYVP